MWQRPQTLALAAIVLCTVAMFPLPIWEKVSPDGVSKLTLYLYMSVLEIQGKEQTVTPIYYLALPFLAAVGLSTFSIFSFKNRVLQMKLGIGISLALAGGAVLVIFRAGNLATTLAGKETGKQLFAYYLPMVSLLLNILANRLIRKDENLIKSMDRLR